MITRFLRNAMKAESGNVAVIFALSLVALMAGSGMAIDVIGANSVKARTNTAADAGVLAAVKAASDAIIAQDNHWKQKAEMAGEAAFRDNLPPEDAANIGALKVRIVQKPGNSFTGTLDYEYTYRTSFMRLFKKNEMKLKSQVSAGMAIPSYIDVHFLIDNSQSMGIGATVADQQKMVIATAGTAPTPSTGCALACHYSDHWTLVTLPNVRASGAKLRIDVVKEAVKKFLTDAKSKRGAADQIRVSIHTFSNKLTLIQAPTTDLDEAIAAADGIDLSAGNLDGGTNIAYSVQQHSAAIGNGGDGLAPDRRQSFVILLSDGVEHSVRFEPSTTMPGRWAYKTDPNFTGGSPQHHEPGAPPSDIQTFDGAACDTYKSGNHAVMAARVHYLRPFEERAMDNARLDFIEDQLPTAMDTAFGKCASRNEYAVEAVASSEIEPMFKHMLDVVFAPSLLRLTQ